MRQRRQREVAKENEFYMQLLQQALPVPQETTQTPVTTNSTSPEKSKGELRFVCWVFLKEAVVLMKFCFLGTPSPTTEHDSNKLSNGSVANGIPAPPNSSTKNNHRKSLDKGPEKDQQEKKIPHSHTNGSIHSEVEYIERVK